MMYAGTKKWGTVRIIIKRCRELKLTQFIIVFEEQFKYKQNKRAEQEKHEKEVCTNDRKHEFDIIVRAANPKRKLSTVVSVLIDPLTHYYRLKQRTVMPSRRIWLP